MGGSAPGPLAPRLLAWFERHGRRDLPWQRDPTPYRVWVSEIMLQQTQVGTVVPYFERFVARFPDSGALASAPLDAVLHRWSGLGYYARARNLHRSAQAICERHAGELPTDRDALEALPGIGRSTAAAILALARDERHAILDGNVKRVLCRFHGIEEWPGRSAVTRRLWTLAETHTPHARVAEYTQAIMDLGATVCVRARPACAACPLAADCIARARGLTGALPAPRPRRDRPVRRTRFLVVRDAHGRTLLERRPPAGVWGGLWGFPECGADDDPATWCIEQLGFAPARTAALAPLRHGFTHFQLDIEPLLVEIGDAAAGAGRVMDGPDRLWYNPASPAALGLAAPVERLLAGLATSEEAPQ